MPGCDWITFCSAHHLPTDWSRRVLIARCEVKRERVVMRPLGFHFE